MNTIIVKEISSTWDAVIIPVSGEVKTECLPESLRGPVMMACEKKAFSGEKGSLCVMNLPVDGSLRTVVLAGLGKPDQTTNREVFLNFAKAFKKCKEAKAAQVSILLDMAKEVTHNIEVAEKLFQVPYLVNYEFLEYKTNKESSSVEIVEFVTEQTGFAELLQEASISAESTLIVRDLVNHPSMFMTPVQLGKEAEQIGEICNVEVEVINREKAAQLGMGAFLSVAKGAVDEPVVVVMRYRGGVPGEAPIALVGKGVMFDSGGYSIKSKMATMHDDMAGGAAVIGAIRTIALQKLPINVTAVVAACKNMISGDAYVPGDILKSMNGKTIEMLNADAEGRLTLADAITYAVRVEGAGTIIDIATLTGAAKGAVGGRCAAVISNDDSLFDTLNRASKAACEKVWRLDADEELFQVLKSSVADIKNSNPGNTMGGGTIVAGLFIREFVENKPWVHVDMAPVNWIAEDSAYCVKGGSGYGTDLLYKTVKLLALSKA